MFCEVCKKELDDNLTVCPDCGVALVPALSGEHAIAKWVISPERNVTKFWPKGSDGNPENVVYLTHCTCLNYDDVMMINMLDAYGIPAIKHYPQNGVLGKLILGMSGNGADIYVPVSMLEDAKKLITEDIDND